MKNDYDLKKIDHSQTLDWFHALWNNGNLEKINGIDRSYAELIHTLKYVLEETSLYLLCDTDGKIIDVSKSFCKALKYKEGDLTGVHYLSLQHHSIKEKVKVSLNGSKKSKLTKFETIPLNKDGNPVILQAYIIHLVSNSTEGNVHLIIHQDITRLKQAEKVIKEIVAIDNLTGLPNRDKFERDMMDILERPTKDTSFALLFVDLDRFKFYNDTLGHFTGDKLIQVIAQSLLSLRYSGLQVYRYGGDEFSLIFQSPESKKDVQQLAEEILELFKNPFIVKENELFITASVGISTYPEMGESYDAIVTQAEMAMHYVKERGNNDFQWYKKFIRTDHEEKLKMEKRLRIATESKNFQLHYQPQIDLRGNKVIGVEALLRWEDRQLGYISPSRFIPLAEETGLIIPIGDWVLEEACRQAKVWFDQGHRLRIGINISPIQFQRPDFVSKVKHILEKTDLPPNLLDLEITENDLLYNLDESFRTLERLKQYGISISIDDFGTGYSSLSYLRRFPIDTLKIDQSFIREVLDNSNDQVIVTSIIQLAHNMNLRVIAEGVETAGMVLFLNERKCDEMQGFLYSKPLPAEDVTTFIYNTNPEKVLI